MIREFHFTITPQSAENYTVDLRVGNQGPVTGSFFFPMEGAAIAGALDEIVEGNPALPAIIHVGEELWVGLANHDVLAAFEQGFQTLGGGGHAVIRLAVPDTLRSLPWEALYYRKKGFFCGADDFSISHAPNDLANIRPFSGPKPPPLRLLIIVPERSGLRVQPEIESITNAFESLGCGKPEILNGRVEPQALHDKLRNGPWDIVHFIGHGAVNEDGRVEIDLNKSNGAPLPYDAEEFAASIGAARPSLVVMNCCHGNAGETHEGLNGCGPLLMRSGVPAVVAMQYAISNDMALLFSETFYDRLFRSPSAGRIDRALEEGRGALRRVRGSDVVRAFITPVLHLAPGYEQLFAVDRVRPPRTLVYRTKPSFDVEPLPADLSEAIREQRCFPVIGPGILSAHTLREQPGTGKAAPVGPRELAQELARNERRKYPRDQDLHLCEAAGEWMNAQLLQWVTQYYEARSAGRSDLVREIRRQYAARPAPALLAQIAQWKVPLLFYTHFDGYLEAHVARGESWLNNIVYQFDQPLALAHGERALRSLVLLRGSYSIADVPLVLTEDDHDELAGRVANLCAQLKSAVRASGSSVLFLGVSPRDPVIRQLSLQLLVAGKKRQQGPTYFAWHRPDDVDRAYWDKYNVQWLPYDTGTLIELVTEEMKQA